MANGTDHDGERSTRVTNADLDRRISHVEGVQELHGVRLHELGNEVNVIGLKVEHSQEMIRVRFTGLESKVDSAAAKLDAILEQGRASREDPTASPAGRAILEKIEVIEQWRKQADPTIDGARSVMTAWRIVAGGSILTTVAALVAVAAALGAFTPRGPL
jgi:hypothetical protein